MSVLNNAKADSAGLLPSAHQRPRAAATTRLEELRSREQAMHAAEPRGSLHRWLGEARARGASDVLFVAGWPVTFNIRGCWTPESDATVNADEILAWGGEILSAPQQERLAAQRDLDIGLRIEGAGRFRVNLHYQNQTLAAAIRVVPPHAPALEELGLPEAVSRLADFRSGLVLVTGGTGHGKSTTLASLLSRMNESRACHIVTLEDPVEFEFPRGLAIIEQREIGMDSPSFASALRHVVRQRPDVIMVGEMRDLETISAAITAAETGHLVLASLHTSNAPQTLARIIDVFPAAQQLQVRAQVAASLRAVLAQVLVPAGDDATLRPATELMFANDAMRRAIRDNETHLLYGMIETGRSQDCWTLEQSLADLVREGRLAEPDALAAAAHPDRLGRLLGH